MGDDAPDVAPRRYMACERMLQQKIHHGLKALIHMLRTLRMMLTDIGQHPVELTDSRAGKAQSHKPYLAQIARTSSSVAKSPRAAAASDSSNSASSSGVKR